MAPQWSGWFSEPLLNPRAYKMNRNNETMYEVSDSIRTDMFGGGYVGINSNSPTHVYDTWLRFELPADVDIPPPTDPLEGKTLGVDYLLIPGHDPSEGVSAYIEYQDVPSRYIREGGVVQYPFISGYGVLWVSSSTGPGSGVITMTGGLPSDNMGDPWNSPGGGLFWTDGDGSHVEFTDGYTNYPYEPWYVDFQMWWNPDEFGNLNALPNPPMFGGIALHDSSIVPNRSAWFNVIGVVCVSYPSYRYWIPSPPGTPIPPMRQRGRNDGLTNDTRQERRSASPSNMILPDLWWVGKPGTPPDPGGS